MAGPLDISYAWTLAVFYYTIRGHVTIVEHAITQRLKDDLAMSATSVNLNSYSRNFYSYASKIAALYASLYTHEILLLLSTAHNGNHTLAAFIYKTFQNRIPLMIQPFRSHPSEYSDERKKHTLKLTRDESKSTRFFNSYLTSF